mmetsp:Transcript_2174/g.5115  ORF Transcript_2174/g.5115 Transcript_2174/m.5115 type:complete len:218 (-) Transcript_2174:634-1287(-)
MSSRPSFFPCHSPPLLRKQVMSDSLTSVHTDMNCCFHCVTAIEVLQMTALHFLMLATAEMPTNVLPAPHGSTMNPDRARPWLNILDSDFSWYERMKVPGRASILRSGVTLSFAKSYSSRHGNLSWRQRCLTSRYMFLSISMCHSWDAATSFAPTRSSSSSPPPPSMSASSSDRSSAAAFAAAAARWVPGRPPSAGCSRPRTLMLSGSAEALERTRRA